MVWFYHSLHRYPNHEWCGMHNNGAMIVLMLNLFESFDLRQSDEELITSSLIILAFVRALIMTIACVRVKIVSQSCIMTSGFPVYFVLFLKSWSMYLEISLDVQAVCTIGSQQEKEKSRQICLYMQSYWCWIKDLTYISPQYT